MTNDLQVEVKQKSQATKGKLIIGLLFDAIGMLTYSFYPLTEIGDVIWAPIAAFAISMMYKGTVGKLSGVIAFIEEITPGLDFIPTFTITWLYEYYQEKKNK